MEWKAEKKEELTWENLEPAWTGWQVAVCLENMLVTIISRSYATISLQYPHIRLHCLATLFLADSDFNELFIYYSEM